MDFGPAKKIPVFAMKDNKHRSRMETPAPWRQVDMFIFNHYCIFVNSPSSNLISTYIWYVVASSSTYWRFFSYGCHAVTDFPKRDLAKWNAEGMK